ncbi:MAG: hypothetical protein QM214_03600 [Bacillota bacterium]|jgi:hypothetical protein|nr:hypothetical protein [Bacillota bacterium]HHU43834.1 hypothetical protein [Clostridiales bacterium]
MAKRNKYQEFEQPRRKVMRPVYRIVNNTGVVPVAKPASNIQLTPIVQPISFVPYSTQSQPIFTDDQDYDY